jgi:hypothetical protein
MHEINALTPREKSGIDPQGRTHESLANEVAMYIVSHTAVTDVVACLVGLMEDLGQELSDKVADIIDYLLPLNYAPGVIQRLYAQLVANQLGLIENEVATQSLAEIIMAGYDQKPAKFAAFTDGDPDVRGRTALDYCDGPEVGPAHAASESIGVLQAACNLLCDLHTRQGTLLGMPYKPLPRQTTSVQSEVELQRMIQNVAQQLRGELASISKMHRNRTVYCVLPSLSEDAPQRDFRKRVISEVRIHVPQLIFVELMPTPDERESEVRNYIRARVIRTQHARKL